MSVSSFFTYGLLILLATSLGSFLNVVATRLPLISAGAFEQGKRVSLSHPASRCPKCKALISWHDNIPVLGWIKRQGRCADCPASIPLSYLVTEVIPAFLVGLTLYQVGVSVEAAVASAIMLSLFSVSIVSCRAPFQSQTVILTIILLALVSPLVVYAFFYHSIPSAISIFGGFAAGFALYATLQAITRTGVVILSVRPHDALLSIAIGLTFQLLVIPFIVLFTCLIISSMESLKGYSHREYTTAAMALTGLAVMLIHLLSPISTLSMAYSAFVWG